MAKPLRAAPGARRRSGARHFDVRSSIRQLLPRRPSRDMGDTRWSNPEPLPQRPDAARTVARHEQLHTVVGHRIGRLEPDVPKGRDLKHASARARTIHCSTGGGIGFSAMNPVESSRALPVFAVIRAGRLVAGPCRMRVTHNRAEAFRVWTSGSSWYAGTHPACSRSA
jgi:hypothetical protein